MELKKEFTINKTESSDTLELFEIFDAKDEIVYKLKAEGSQVEYFYDKSKTELLPTSIEITNIRTGLTKKYLNEKSSEWDVIIDLEGILEDLKNPKNGSMNVSKISDVLKVWSFGRVSADETSDYSFECDCCGSISNSTITMKNHITNTKVSFTEDNHFGGSYLPTFHDVLNFILNGECTEDFSKD